MRWTDSCDRLWLYRPVARKRKRASPYLSLVARRTTSVRASDAVFEQVEDHARCAGFHRASADRLPRGAETKVAFYEAVAKDAETAAVQLASAKISKDLAVDMVDQMARGHAARWSYLIAADCIVRRGQTSGDDLLCHGWRSNRNKSSARWSSRNMALARR